MVEQSDRILVGRLGSFQSVKERIAINDQGDFGNFVYTYVDVTPTEHIKDDLPAGQKVRLKLLGGRIGKYGYFVPGSPSLYSSEKVMLFLHRRGSSPDDAPLYGIEGAKYGVFHISEGGEEEVASRQQGISNDSLGIGPSEGIGEDPIPLAKLKGLIAKEVHKGAGSR